MAQVNAIAAVSIPTPSGDLKPRNCHEAVLGWLLQGVHPHLAQPSPLSDGVPEAWRIIRNLSNSQAGANPQITGTWMSNNIYTGGVLRVLEPLSHGSFGIGDAVSMGNFHAPHHSMLVVHKAASSVYARGFNNAGAFGGPYMSFDTVLRDLSDSIRWNGRSEFMGNNGPAPIHTVSFTRAAANLAAVL